MLIEAPLISIDQDYQPPFPQGDLRSGYEMTQPHSLKTVSDLNVDTRFDEQPPSEIALTAEMRMRYHSVWIPHSDFTHPVLTADTYSPGRIVIDREELTDIRDREMTVLYEESLETHTDAERGTTYRNIVLLIDGGYDSYGIGYDDGINPEVTIVFGETLQYDGGEGVFFKYIYPSLEQRESFKAKPHAAISGFFALKRSVEAGSYADREDLTGEDILVASESVRVAA